MSEVKLDSRVLDRLIKDAPKELDEAIGRTAFKVEGDAKTKAPVLTGALRNSLETVKTGRFKRRVQDGVEYGIHQELGTSRMGARPFLVPAVEGNEDTLTKEIQKAFAEALR